VYRKNLRKGVDQYTKSSPPHVKAARLLPSPGGVIRYVITVDGPQPVGHVTSPIDYDHYVDKQVAPIVESIAKAARFDAQAAIRGTPGLFRM
jgi:DNA polymerase-2